MARREQQPFNSDPNTGRIGYRHDWEPMDERPTIYYTEPFWESPEEEAVWLRAVRSCPLSEYGSLDVFAYLARWARMAVGLGGKVRRMPHVRMSRVERDRQLQKLRGQMPSNMEIL